MKKATPIRLAKRVERWQHRLALLGVSHFQFDVHLADELPGERRDADACVQVSGQYDTCSFWFRWSFIENCTAAELDQTIIHEWLHVAFRDFDDALEAAEGWMPPRTFEDYDAKVNHEREGIVERLARQLWAFYSTD